MLDARCRKLVVLFLATFYVGSSAFEPEREAKRYIPASLARFELVLGRLQMSCEHFRIGAAFERSQLEDGRERTRSISVSTYRGKPTLQFRDNGGDEEVLLSFKSDRNVDIEQSVGRGLERYTLGYHQSDEGPVTLKVVFCDGSDSLEFKSRSLWHLAIEEPQAFDNYLRPCLMRLEPSWQLARTVASVRELKKNPSREDDIKAFERLIEQLDSDLASERGSAMSRLESMGVAAESRLRQSLATQLTSQQEQSILRLLNRLQPIGNDTPMRVAIWLSDEWH